MNDSISKEEAWLSVVELLDQASTLSEAGMPNECNRLLSQVLGIMNLFTGKTIQLHQIHRSGDVFKLYDIEAVTIEEEDGPAMYPKFMIDEKTGKPKETTT